MKELAGKSAVITGASRGIGEAAAIELASHGVSLVLVARSSDSIDALAKKIAAEGGNAVAVTAALLLLSSHAWPYGWHSER